MLRLKSARPPLPLLRHRCAQSGLEKARSWRGRLRDVREPSGDTIPNRGHPRHSNQFPDTILNRAPVIDQFVQRCVLSSFE